MREPSRYPADDTLVERSRAGDPRALALLYERHAGALHRYLERRTGDSAVAEDFVQESFLRIFQRRGRYDGKGRFRAWLFTVATRLASDWSRTRRRRSEIAGAFAEDLAPPACGDPLQRVRRQELLTEIEAALADLPRSYSDTFQLRVCEGFSYREIGEMLGEPEGTLRSRVHHALKRVRARLAREDMPGETNDNKRKHHGSRHE